MGKSLREYLIELSGSHEKISGKKGYTDTFYFDQQNRTISNGPTKIMENGLVIPQKLQLKNNEIIIDETIPLMEERSTNDFFQTVELLYQEYKYSMPNKYSAKSNFFALQIEKISLTRLATAMDRNVARTALE